METRTVYYKVLRDGHACHGGNFDYTDYLPRGERPGKWTPKVEPRMCDSGYHATDAAHLHAWLRGGNQVWEVEFKDEPTAQSDKVVAAQMRFLRRVGHGETVGNVLVVTHGETSVSSGIVLASGSSKVEAHGSSTVEAHDSSTVRAYNSSTVEAHDHSTVEAHDHSTVRAYNSSTVRAYDISTVRAYNSSTVRAYNSSTVLKGRYFSSAVKVDVFSGAVLIDRSGDGIRVVTAQLVDVVLAR